MKEKNLLSDKFDSVVLGLADTFEQKEPEVIYKGALPKELENFTNVAN